MNPDVQALDPRERLALSRKALIAQLGGEDHAPESHAQTMTAPAARPREEGGVKEGMATWMAAWVPIARNVARRWWRRHPVNAAGKLARPLLEQYARKQPAKLVAAAAAAGALVVLFKPWRLLSITAVVAAALKTSDVADMVTTVMQKNANPRKDHE